MKVILINGTCNSYYLPEERVLIDAGGMIKEAVEVLIFTHCHFDHLTYANNIIRKNKPLVYCGEGDRLALLNLGEKVIPEFLADLTPIKAKGLKEGDVVRGLRVIETPGHTEGSICLLKENYLFSGDTLFDVGFGRIDLPSGNIYTLRESLRKLDSIPYKFLMPGH